MEEVERRTGRRAVDRVNSNYREINAKRQMDDPRSVYNFYR